MEDLEAIIKKRAEEIARGMAVAEKPAQEQVTPPVPAKSHIDKASEFVEVISTQKAAEDETLLDSVAQSKKKEIIHRANASLKKEEAENKNADIMLQEANFGVHSGVAAYAGIKKPLPQKMQTVLFTILSAIQLIVLITVGVPISIFNIICDSVDSSVTKLASLTTAARKLVFALLAIGAVALVVYIVLHYLARFGIL